MVNKKLKEYRESLRIDDTDYFECELTGITTPNIAFHHIKKRSQGGSDDRDNLLGVDWFIHSSFHDGYKNFKRKLLEFNITNSEELWLKMGGKKNLIYEV